MYEVCWCWMNELCYFWVVLWWDFVEVVWMGDVWEVVCECLWFVWWCEFGIVDFDCYCFIYVCVVKRLDFEGVWLGCWGGFDEWWCDYFDYCGRWSIWVDVEGCWGGFSDLRCVLFYWYRFGGWVGNVDFRFFDCCGFKDCVRF